MFLRKDVLKICSKFTGEHPWRRVISIKLQESLWVAASEQGGCENPQSKVKLL